MSSGPFCFARPYGAITDGYLEAELAGLKEAGLFKRERVITSKQAGTVRLADGSSVINLCANNYLGLADNAEIAQAAHDALDRYGYGMASVRFICGTQEEHKALEKRIADFLGLEDAILYSSCFDANTGLFETILGEEDAIISDALNHASIIDGVRLCKAQRHRYANNHMGELESSLKAASNARFRLVATDGVFSMDGIIANLQSVCDLAEKHDAMVMVDDSHAVGFLGEHGRGSIEHCGVEGRVHIVTGTLGKALGGASGGYTAGPAPVIEWLRQRSRPYLFSNTLAPVIAAASLKVFELIENGDHLRDEAFRQCKAFPLADDEARLQARGRGSSDHSGDAGRGEACPRHGRRDDGARRLRYRLLFSGGAEGAGPHPHADVGGAFAAGSRPGNRGLCANRP